MRRIVVTGLGAVTPLAANVEASWTRLLAGRSGNLFDDEDGDGRTLIWSRARRQNGD